MTDTTSTPTERSPQHAANAAVAGRLVTDVINRGRMELIDELLHPEYVYHGPGGLEIEGPDGVRELIGGFRAGFSDLHAEITSQIAEGDLVAMTMVATGTHDGDLMGVPPTGAKVELPMAIVSRVEEGRIAEEWEYYDSSTLMGQLGDGPATPTTLVIGAKGKTGSRVAERLTAAGLPVRAASRTGDTRFDWEDPTTWAPALEGVDAAYITYYPDLAFPGAAEIVGDFADLAVARGVRRLVLLSGRGEDGARHAEKRLQDSGADWTIVRCAFFNQNFSEVFADAVRYGDISMPGGGTAEPFLDADDIADVAFAALTEEGHTGRLYELTGPRLMTIAEVAEELSAAVGREVKYEALTAPEYAERLAAVGVPEEDAVPFAELIAEVLDGRNSYLTEGVQQALGRAPRDFADYAARTAESGAWDVEESG